MARRAVDLKDVVTLVLGWPAADLGAESNYCIACEDPIMRPRSSVVEREIPALWCILKAIRSIRVGVKCFYSFIHLPLHPLSRWFLFGKWTEAVGLGWSLNIPYNTIFFLSRHSTLTGTFETRPHLST